MKAKITQIMYTPDVVIFQAEANIEDYLKLKKRFVADDMVEVK